MSNIDLQLDIRAVKPVTTPAFTVSSHTLDKIISGILESDLENEIELPSRLQPNVSYGRDLNNWYRSQDVQFVQTKYLAGLTEVELSVLDALTRWSFRNTGNLMRSATGLVACALFKVAKPLENDYPISAVETGKDIYSSLISENVWTIRRLCQTATSGESIDAKIPLRTFGDVFNNLTDLTVKDRTTPNKLERERQVRLLTNVVPSRTLQESSMDRTDFAVGRLIQMTKAVARYKREDGFGRLRSFLTNASMMATMVRVKAHDDLGLARLCSDVLDMFHSIDRLLNANCVAANSLLDRMQRGELVYDEVMAMGRHQHRIVAVEYSAALTLFAYLLKQADIDMYDDADVRSAANRLIIYSGVSEQYTSEIVNKQAYQ